MKTKMRSFLKNRKAIRLNGKSGKGVVVLSYLREPFLGLPEADARGHTNWQESRIIATTWNTRGYDVEIIDWHDDRYQPPANTAVAIDIHKNLEKWGPVLPQDCRKVLHATGAHWLTQNAAEYLRLEAIRDRRGISLIPRRQSLPNRSDEWADAITILGNKFTLDTWAFAKAPTYRIPISCAIPFLWPQLRDWTSARRKFLWAGSYGMVHKGLDLVLEAFAAMPEFHLTVCGRPEKETDFFDAYQKELLHTPNIHLAGWICAGSEKFTDICRTHCAMVYPSCSEGGGGALIHAMAGGLIPIATRESSVDLDDFGEPITAPDVEAVQHAVRRIADSFPDSLEDRARRSWLHVRDHHSITAFEKSYAQFAESLDPQ